MARRRKYEYFATYLGKHKVISLSGVGRIHSGKEFEVSENIFNTLRLDPNFKTRKGFKIVAK